MKTHRKNLFHLPALITGLGLMLAGQASAQTFTTLYSFTDGSDGSHPDGELLLSGNTLYGTAEFGGLYNSVNGIGYGTVFAVNTDGTGFTTLYGFTAASNGFAVGSTNSDGCCPETALVLSGNTLYGTAEQGGTSGNGTVFAVNTDGTGLTTLYNFTGGSDGGHPLADLLLSGNTLYGTANTGAGSGKGTVFAVNTDGSDFTVLHSFTAQTSGTNSDGAEPSGALVLSGNTMYGTANVGGSSGWGTVFAVNTNGMGFTNLHSFSAMSTNSSGVYTNSDGARPNDKAGLVLSGNTLYGTAVLGGTSGNGTVFAVNTDGTGFTTLHSFTAQTSGTNSDGATPNAGLILAGNTLYGTATHGGSSGNGTVFAVNTDGTGFTTLYSFTGGSDGKVPAAGLLLSGNTLYGTTPQSSPGFGTVFSLSLPPVSAPQLTISPSGANVILSWPATAAGFTLQSTTNLGSLAFWTTNSPAPVVVNGQNVVTNPLAGAQKFFRLSQ
jgi:uncharacterized repeat protein (TIGR03803 family)